MKVLILANSVSGLIKFRYDLIKKMKQEGYDITVVCPNGDIDENEQLLSVANRMIPLDIDRRGINSLKDIKLINKYKNIIKNEKFDKVITYTIKCNIYGGIAAKKYNIPCFANITGLGTGFQKKIIRKIVTFLYKKALSCAQKVFFENEDNMKLFIKSKIIDSTKAILLNGAGVDLHQYDFEDLKNNERINFLFAGRVMKEKGINELLATAKRCSEEGLKIKFTIVGDLEEDYREILEDYSTRGVIYYAGYQKDIKPFIKDSDCIILPSYHEGMSNILLEGAAMGRPIIASNIPGCKEAIIDGNNGYLVNVKDEIDLYEKIIQFYRLSFDERKLMGIQSRRHMCDVFDKDKVVNKTFHALCN